jgi:apolipoprotein N-acyltransferase
VRTPIAAVSGSSIRSADLGGPALVVFLVLALGATIFLWRARYIRRRTAYVAMGVIVVGLIIFGALLYTAPA